MVSLTNLKAYVVVLSKDIHSLLKRAALSEKPRSAAAFPREIVRAHFAKRERYQNILPPVTSTTLDKAVPTGARLL